MNVRRCKCPHYPCKYQYLGIVVSQEGIRHNEWGLLEKMGKEETGIVGSVIPVEVFCDQKKCIYL